MDVLSECSDQPNNEELEILEEEDEEEEEEDLTPTNSVKAAFSPNRRSQNQHHHQQQQQRTNHDRESMRSSLSQQRNNADDGQSTTSIGVGVSADRGQGPEDYLLLSGAHDAAAAGNGHLRVALNDGEAPHWNSPLPPSPALLQASLNESSDANHDTIHSTEKLIHV